MFTGSSLESSYHAVYRCVVLPRVRLVKRSEKLLYDEVSAKLAPVRDRSDQQRSRILLDGTTQDELQVCCEYVRSSPATRVLTCSERTHMASSDPFDNCSLARSMISIPVLFVQHHYANDRIIPKN
jgi:hypothetical protein